MGDAKRRACNDSCRGGPAGPARKAETPGAARDAGIPGPARKAETPGPASDAETPAPPRDAGISGPVPEAATRPPGNPALVADTEAFFREVMRVYLDLLVRGERDSSRLLFRSGVRFASAVHGLQRAGARTGRPGATGRAAGTSGSAAQPAGVTPAARAAAAARSELDRCLFAAWSVRNRQAARAAAAGETAPFGGPDTTTLFDRGLALRAALRDEPDDHAAPPGTMRDRVVSSPP